MDAKKKKRRNYRRGMSLTETMVVLLVLGILTTAIALSAPNMVLAYRESTAASETGSLCSTLYLSITDELRFATDIRADGSFDSASYGSHVGLDTTDGRVQLGGYDLVGSGMYGDGRYQADVTNTYNAQDKTFSVALTVMEGDILRQQIHFTVRPIN